MGRAKKNALHSFRHKADWDGTPTLRVLEFLRRFTKACDDNAISEGMAFYMLQEFTKGDLRTELRSIIPSSSSGGAGEVTSYLELVNWLLRAMVDEAVLASLVEKFTQAHQAETEDEMSFAERVRKLNNLCGFLHPQAVVKSQFVEGLHWSVRIKTRERNTARATLAELARLAYRGDEAYRKLREEQRQELQSELAKEREEARQARELREARRIRKDKVVAAVGTSQGTSSASQVGKTPPGADHRCWNCNADGHWAYDCPMLSERIQQLVKNASMKSASDEVRSRREGGSRPVVAVATPSAEGADTSSFDSSSSSPPSDSEAKSAGNE